MKLKDYIIALIFTGKPLANHIEFNMKSLISTSHECYKYI